MSQLFEIHPLNPQLRLILQTVEIMREGGVIGYATVSCYALGCHLGDKESLERIRGTRRRGKAHHSTLVCRDLPETARYARIDHSQYRLLRKSTPGTYTLLLRTTRETPKRLQNPRRRTIG